MKKYNYSYLFIGILLFFFAPIEIYLASIDDMWFSIYDFAGYIIAAFGIYVAIWLAYERIIADKNEKMNLLFSNIVLSTGLAAYIQGNFIVVDYGDLNGKPINWNEYRMEGFISGGLFLLSLIVAVVIIVFSIKKKLYDKNKKFANSLSLLLILLMIYTIVVLLFTKNGLQSKDKYVATSSGRWDYSETENYIILLLDDFDSRALDDLLEGESECEVRAELQDFTYYSNTNGLYQITMLAVPQILSGEKYLSETDYRDYLEESFASSTFLNRMLDEGYRLKIHTGIELPQSNFVEKVDNWHYMNIGVSSHRRLLEYIYKLVGFKYAPQQLKQLFWFYSDDMEQIETVKYEGGIESEVDEHYEWGNLYFVNNLKELNTSLDEPVFHFTHLKGTHAIRDVNENFEYVGESDTEVTYIEAARMNVKLVKNYMDTLKTKGIYDESVVIIMADHGDGSYNDFGANSTPLFLIKGKNERHEFIANDRAVTYDDLQTTFIGLLEGKTSDEAIAESGENQTRYVYLLDFSAPEKRGRVSRIVEYSVTGNSKDISCISATGRSFY